MPSARCGGELLASCRLRLALLAHVASRILAITLLEYVLSRILALTLPEYVLPVIIGAVVAVALLLCICCLVSKEKAGKPVFSSVEPGKVASTASASSAAAP